MLEIEAYVLPKLNRNKVPNEQEKRQLNDEGKATAEVLSQDLLSLQLRGSATNVNVTHCP